MNRFAVGACLLAALVLPSPVAAQVDGAGPESVLAPGDVLRIDVWRQPELSGQFDIGPDGSIVHPLYREVAVAGLPLSSVEERLRSFLERYEANPSFVVQPLFRVAVGGEVRSPDVYRFPPETSVARAVLMAGGTTERGRLDRVRLLRDGQVFSVDLLDPRAQADRVRVRSGDQIIVTARGESFFRRVIVPASSLIGAMVAVAHLFL